MARLSSFVCGLLMAIGLGLSGMTQPHKVIHFLDLSGAWDPSLAVVMGGALLVVWPAYRWMRRRSRPLFGERFQFPNRREIDPKLLLGAGLFGLGWGLGGYCPGPALVSLPSGGGEVLLFCGAMLVGVWLASGSTPKTEEPPPPSCG